ncbi:hypothetical protein BOX15_Mlig003214g2, partial [Macrostomum lignano]
AIGMSRGGGRGGGRGGRGGGSFIVQSYKNLMRSDGHMPLGGVRVGDDEQTLYPPLPRRPAPPTVVKDLKFMVAAKRDLEDRFSAGASLPAVPNSANFPAELDWLRRKRRRQQQQQQSSATTVAKNAAAAGAKRRRQDVVEAAASALLDEVVGGQLETSAEAAKEAATSATIVAGGGEGGDGEERDDDEDEEAGVFENDEELEDNDYVDAYFDNGEGYGPDDGEEDLDGESWYY